MSLSTILFLVLFGVYVIVPTVAIVCVSRQDKKD